MSDDGRPDARLAAALHHWSEQPTSSTRAEVLAALSGARVFLALASLRKSSSGGTLQQGAGHHVEAVDTVEAVDAVAQRGPDPSMRSEPATDMVLMSVLSRTGARALVVFVDGHRVQHWRPEARPVPVPGPQACATALADDAQALLLDPHAAALAVTREELTALAQGRVPVPGSSLTTRRTEDVLGPLSGPAAPELLTALTAALAGEPVSAARLLQGPDGPVLGVVPAGQAGAADLAALAGRVATRLGANLPAAGLDLAVVPAEGTGTEVPLRSRRRRGWGRH